MPDISIDNKTYEVSFRKLEDKIEAYTVTEYSRDFLLGYGSDHEEALKDLKDNYNILKEKTIH